MPLSSIMTISPGFTSRIHSAPITSKAQVSDETTTAPLAIFPIDRGRNPFGSRAAINLSSNIKR